MKHCQVALIQVTPSKYTGHKPNLTYTHHSINKMLLIELKPIRPYTHYPVSSLTKEDLHNKNNRDPNPSVDQTQKPSIRTIQSDFLNSQKYTLS